jgi:hypothetical protein
MTKNTNSKIREEDVRIIRSRAQANKLIRWVGTDKRRYAQMMEYFLNGDEQLAKKSAWILGHVTEKYPELVKPWLEPMIKKIGQDNVHGALKRNAIRILQFAEIPKKVQGIVTNLCFKFLSSQKEETAVRTFAITVIGNIAKDQPELMNELEIVVRQQIPCSAPAFRARARMVLKSRKIEEESKISYEEWLTGKE